ncbi:MAG: hypothetical protein NXI04_05535 [Planctomycetaceae bacterium]|nr:hypothetical protein [Planctomycetaceae bacterium]
MKSLTTCTLLIVLSCSLTGCSRFRQLTRRDYASMEDPFAEPMSEDPRFQPEASPTMTASHSRDADSAGQLDRLRVSGATLTSEVGAAADDFLQRSEAAGTAAVQDAGAFAQQQFEEVENQTLQEMSQFLGDQATASGLTETAQALDEDFAAWAAEQKQEWHRDAQQAATPVAAAAQTAADAIPDFVDHAAADASRFAIEPLEDDIATPFIQRTAAERASGAAGSVVPAAERPLGDENPFARYNAQTAGRVTLGEARGAAASAVPETPAAVAEPQWQRSAAPAAATPELVEDPFVDFDRQPAVPADTTPTLTPPTTTGAPAGSSSLDSRFNFDTGWKPSSVQRP